MVVTFGKRVGASIFKKGRRFRGLEFRFRCFFGLFLFLGFGGRVFFFRRLY